MGRDTKVDTYLSGSMEPAFYRGDLLFLTNPRSSPYQIGDITVYRVRMKFACLYEETLN